MASGCVSASVVLCSIEQTPSTAHACTSRHAHAHAHTHTHTHTRKEKPLLLTCCTSVSPFDVFSVYTNELKILCRETREKKEAGTVRLDQEECLRFGSNHWKPSSEDKYWQPFFTDRFWFQVLPSGDVCYQHSGRTFAITVRTADLWNKDSTANVLSL